MVTDKYELAIDLDNGEWICDITENEEDGVMTFSVEITPPEIIKDLGGVSFFMEMKHKPGNVGELYFTTPDPLHDPAHMIELEGELSNEILTRTL